MNKKPNPELIDEENPEWTKEMFTKARRVDPDLVELSKRSVGRPFSDNPKKRTTIFLDNEVMAFFKAKGKGWQTRINKVLREYADTHHP